MISFLIPLFFVTLQNLITCSVFKDYQKWPGLCDDPHEFCFGENDNETTSNITDGCLSELTTIGSFTYNSRCRILLRASLSFGERDDHRDVRWRLRVPSDWRYTHVTMWFSPFPNLTTNEGCHSIKVIVDKERKFSKGYGYFKYQGINFETDQAFDDDGILAPKSIYATVNLKEKFCGNSNYDSSFTNSSLFNFVWFNFRSFSILEIERFNSELIDLMTDRLYIYLTLNGEDDTGSTVQIVAKRSQQPVLLFPVNSPIEVGLADSTQLAIVALVAFLTTIAILGIYICMTRERHDTHAKGVDVTKEEPNRGLISKQEANDDQRHKIKKHDESHVTSDGFHMGIDHSGGIHS